MPVRPEHLQAVPDPNNLSPGNAGLPPESAHTPPPPAETLPAASSLQEPAAPAAGEPVAQRDTAAADAASPGAPATPELTPAECAARLAELFPALFASIPNTPPRPIKLRIQADIQARAPGLFSRRSLSPFLHRHTTTTAYLKALVASTHRYDLDGAPAGDVADEHRQAAQAELDRRWAIVQARRAAERAARGPGPRARDTAPAGAPGEATPPPAHESRERRGPRPDRAQRPPPPPRAQRPAQSPRAQRPARPPRPEAAARDARRPPAAPSQAGPAAHAGAELSDHARWPDDPARRERAQLLRAFETSTLSRANFCALKRIDPDTLDALLEQARSESRTTPPRKTAPR